jgi:hypothetical protein
LNPPGKGVNSACFFAGASHGGELNLAIAAPNSDPAGELARAASMGSKEEWEGNTWSI